MLALFLGASAAPLPLASAPQQALLPSARIANLWHSVQPSQIRSALIEHHRRTDADHAIVTKESVIYAEQAAMLHNALLTAAGDDRTDTMRELVAADAAAEQQLRSRHPDRRIDWLLSRVWCVPLQPSWRADRASATQLQMQESGKRVAPLHLPCGAPNCNLRPNRHHESKSYSQRLR